MKQYADVGISSVAPHVLSLVEGVEGGRFLEEAGWNYQTRATKAHLVLP